MYGNIREHAANMLVNFAVKLFPGRALAQRRASVLASPLHALEESLRTSPSRAGAPMGVLRALSRGAGGKRRVGGAAGGPGPPPAPGRGRGERVGRPASRAPLPFPPLLCNRALGSIKNSALQADCNAPSLGSTVWSGIKARRSVAFWLQHRQRPGAATQRVSWPCGRQQGCAGLPTAGRARGPPLPPAQGFPQRQPGCGDTAPSRPPSRVPLCRPSARNKSKQKAY